MSKIIKIAIKEDTVNYIHAIDLDVNSTKTLLNSIGDSLGVGTQAFKDYEKEFKKFNAEYQIIQQYLAKIYIPEALNDHSYKWNLNFITNQLILEVTCECGVKLVESGELDFAPNFNLDDLIDKFDSKDDSVCKCGDTGCSCKK